MMQNILYFLKVKFLQESVVLCDSLRKYCYVSVVCSWCLLFTALHKFLLLWLYSFNSSSRRKYVITFVNNYSRVCFMFVLFTSVVFKPLSEISGNAIMFNCSFFILSNVPLSWFNFLCNHCTLIFLVDCSCVLFRMLRSPPTLSSATLRRHVWPLTVALVCLYIIDNDRVCSSG